MTIKEYNKKFLPMIDTAAWFVSRLESAIDHTEIGKEAQEDVRKHMGLRGWSEETKQTILTALEYYRIHEGIEKLE